MLHLCGSFSQTVARRARFVNKFVSPTRSRKNKPGEEIALLPRVVLFQLAFGLELQPDGKPCVERPLVSILRSRGLQEVRVRLDTRDCARKETRVGVPVNTRHPA